MKLAPSIISLLHPFVQKPRNVPLPGGNLEAVDVTKMQTYNKFSL